MEQLSVPVVIHKWFSDGDGWAWHPAWNEQRKWALEAVGKYLKASDAISEEFVAEYGHVTLVGVRTPDHNCLDPKAVYRKPFILRIGLVPKKGADSATIQFVREQLKALDPPSKRGENGGLEILFFPPETPVTVPCEVVSDSLAPRKVESGREELSRLPGQKDRAALQNENEQLKKQNNRLVRESDQLQAECGKWSRLAIWNAGVSFIWFILGVLLCAVWDPVAILASVPGAVGMFLTREVWLPQLTLGWVGK